MITVPMNRPMRAVNDTDPRRAGGAGTVSKNWGTRLVLCEMVWLLDMQAGSSELAVGPLIAAIEGARDACLSNAAARRATIAIGDVPPVRVAIDTDRLTIVLVNVIDNAVKHGRFEGRVALGADVDVHASRG